MSTTIESYKAILATNENDNEKKSGSAKLEFAQMTLQIEKYEHERQKYVTDRVLWNDEKASLIKQLDRAREVESFLREQVEECSDKMGIPKSQMDALKSQNHKLESDIARLQAELVKTKNKLQNVETESNQLNTKLSFELHQRKE